MSQQIRDLIGRRTKEETLQLVETVDTTMLRIKKGFVPGMRTDGIIYVNSELANVLREEIETLYESKGTSFVPALVQVGNAAALPGIVGFSIGLPDIHAGYGFAIGHVAAFDMDDPDSIVSPGGVGFDINCGVRMLRTNLDIDAFKAYQEQIADAIMERIPVGVGGRCEQPLSLAELRSIMEEGMEWAVRREIAWPEDREYCEERGCIRIPGRIPSSLQRAEAKGKWQLGTLGSGNHYIEVQKVTHIYNQVAAAAMGIEKIGQICVMIHCGSRGLGHDIADYYIKAMKNSGVQLNDEMLACAPINSPIGKEYLAAMAGACNFAYVNRAAIATNIRKAFEGVFGKSAREMDMHTVYDVSHNIAKVEEHQVDGTSRRLLVHRKGSTRAFPPGHSDLPAAYREIGQPVLIGGSMGTCSYVLTGTEQGMKQTFGSTCHGAGRAVSRHGMRKLLQPAAVLESLAAKGITIRTGSENAIAEEAPESYKDVAQVVDVCHSAGISQKAFRLEPVCVVKG